MTRNIQDAPEVPAWADDFACEAGPLRNCGAFLDLLAEHRRRDARIEELEKQSADWERAYYAQAEEARAKLRIECDAARAKVAALQSELELAWSDEHGPAQNRKLKTP